MGRRHDSGQFQFKGPLSSATNVLGENALTLCVVVTAAVEKIRPVRWPQEEKAAASRLLGFLTEWYYQADEDENPGKQNSICEKSWCRGAWYHRSSNMAANALGKDQGERGPL